MRWHKSSRFVKLLWIIAIFPVVMSDKSLESSNATTSTVTGNAPIGGEAKANSGKLKCFEEVIYLKNIKKQDDPQYDLTLEGIKDSRLEYQVLRADCTLNKSESYVATNDNCKSHKLVLVKKETAVKQYVILAVTRRGNRIRAISISPNEYKIDIDQRAFHHYSSYAPSGSVIQDIFTISNRLFISTIVKRAYVVLYHVDVTFRNDVLSMRVQNDKGFRISQSQIRPEPHYMNYFSPAFHNVSYATGGYLQVIYKQEKEDFGKKPPEHASVPLKTIFNGFGRPVYVPNSTELPATYSTYVKVNKDFSKCMQTYNSFVAYRMFKDEEIVTDKYIAKTHPVKTETYPLVAMEYKRLRKQRNNMELSGAVVVCTLLALAVASIWLMSFILHWREKLRRYRLSMTHSKTEPAKKP